MRRNKPEKEDQRKRAKKVLKQIDKWAMYNHQVEYARSVIDRAFLVRAKPYYVKYPRMEKSSMGFPPGDKAHYIPLTTPVLPSGLPMGSWVG